MKSATTENAVTIPVGRLVTLEIPCCATCARSSKRLGKRGWLIFAAIGLFVAATTLAVLRLDGDAVTLSILGMLALLGVVIGIIMKTVKSSLPVEAKVVDASRGVLGLRFDNPEYGRLVAKQVTDSDENGASTDDGPSSTAFTE